MPDCAKVRTAPPPPDLSLAFPAALRRSAAALTVGWDTDHWHYTYTVTFGGDSLTVPSRIYVNQGLLWRDDGRRQLERDIACCLGTRHHSGYTREECLRRLLAAPKDWMVPFIVQLIGEYVVEIVEPIADALPGMAPEMQDAFADFIRTNPRYLQTIDSRVVSYWMSYYERAYPDQAGYPGRRAIEYLRTIAASTAA